MDITSIFPDKTENQTIKYGHIGYIYKEALNPHN